MTDENPCTCGPTYTCAACHYLTEQERAYTRRQAERMTNPTGWPQ